MKKKNVKTLLALLLAAVTTLSACGQGEPVSKPSEDKISTETSCESSTTETSESGKVAINIEDLPVITYYPQKASIASGLVTGYKAEAFAKAGVQVEVWAYSKEKTTGILTSGELPDIMYVAGQNAITAIENGYALCLEDYLDKLPNLTKTPYMEAATDNARNYLDAAEGKLYYIPVSIGETAMKTSYLDAAWQVPKVYWDVYNEIGRPEVNDFYGLIDVMEKMVAAHPKTEDGATVWGTILDNGATYANYWGPSQEWLAWNGYTYDYNQYLLTIDAVNDAEFHYLLEDDGVYYEGLKWYNEMYNRGLMDPDSINLDRGTVNSRIESGQCMIPTGTLCGYADDFHEVVIPGQKVYAEDNASTNGTRGWIISAETEHLEECLEFLNLMMDPDFLLEVEWGPEGDVWYVDEKGDAYITEEYAAYCADNSIYPDGFPMSTGDTLQWWNTTMPLSHNNATSYGNGKGGYRTSYVQNWSDRQEIVSATDNMLEWQEFTGYNYLLEMLEDQDMIIYNMPYDSRTTGFQEKPTDEMTLQISSIAEKIKNASWQMVYATSEGEFEKIWEQLKKDVEALEGQKLYEWICDNLENAAVKAGTAK